MAIDAAREFLPPEEAALLEHPRANVIQSDGRGYLAARTQVLTALFEQDSPPPSYDLIIIALPPHLQPVRSIDSTLRNSSNWRNPHWEPMEF